MEPKFDQLNIDRARYYFWALRAMEERAINLFESIVEEAILN